MNSDNSNEIKISGAIGMVKLKKSNQHNINKNVYIFYDDHSNKNYCRDETNIFMNEFFDNMINSTTDCIFLLEELFINSYSKVKFLWNDTPHIVKFRNFYKKIMNKCSNDVKECRIFPTDIRLLLIDVSYDELLNNCSGEDSEKYFEDLKHTCPTPRKYFEKLLFLFDICDNIERTDENLFFIKNVFDLNKNYEYYINLKEKFIQMYDEYIKFFENIKLVEFVKKYSNDQLYFTFGFPFEYSTVNKSFYDMFDKLLNGLMEFYIYILVEKMPNKNIIIHAGYYHTSNLVYLMETYCNYDKIYKQGTIENIHKNNQDVANCMYIDKQVFEDFYN